MVATTIFGDYKGNFNKLRDGELYLYKDNTSKTPFKAYVNLHTEKNINKPQQFAASSVNDLYAIIKHGCGLDFGNTEFLFESKRNLRKNEENFPVADYINVAQKYITRM